MESAGFQPEREVRGVNTGNSFTINHAFWCILSVIYHRIWIFNVHALSMSLVVNQRAATDLSVKQLHTNREMLAICTPKGPNYEIATQIWKP